jgi:hypothetical protein
MSKELTKLKKDTWSWCSKYIRLKYADNNGYVACYTCGTVMYWQSGNQMQAGHGFGGRGNSILFEEKILRPQCYSCNICKKGNYDVFHTKLEKQYGYGFLQKMLKQKNTTKQFTIQELTRKRNKFKKLAEELSK